MDYTKLNLFPLSQLDEMRKELEATGFKKAQAIVSVEVGILIGKLVTIVTGKTKQGKDIVEPACSAMPFTRKPKFANDELSLYWDAVTFNAAHKDSMKSYENLKVSATDELRKEISNPANYDRECELICKLNPTNNKTHIEFVKWN